MWPGYYELHAGAGTGAGAGAGTGAVAGYAGVECPLFRRHFSPQDQQLPLRPVEPNPARNDIVKVQLA